jgi:ElaB/YqjD/DUF883 family membrane-anchored ribosome-binding protein
MNDACRAHAIIGGAPRSAAAQRAQEEAAHMTSSGEGGVEPQTVDQARDAVERSRERISATLDRLEDRIVEKKQELQEKADVFRPVKNQVRQRPLIAIAVAVGVGALVGSLGRGRENRASLKQPLTDEDARRELREWREHRRERLRALAAGADPYHVRRSSRSSRFDTLKGQLMGAATTAITAALTARLKEFARGSGGRDSSRR